jgi:hypothetical protein
MHAGLGAAVEGSFSMEKIGKPAPFAKRAKDAPPEKSKAKGLATRRGNAGDGEKASLPAVHRRRHFRAAVR